MHSEKCCTFAVETDYLQEAEVQLANEVKRRNTH